MHRSKQIEKYVPVELAARPAPAAEAEAHLRAFIAAFIQPRAQPRWLHCLLTNPQKAGEQLQRFHRDLDPAKCQSLQGAEGFPLRLESRFGRQVGVYFTGVSPALLATPAEAATMVTEEGSDALLSLIPGERVLCFDHDGGVWLCER